MLYIVSIKSGNIHVDSLTRVLGRLFRVWLNGCIGDVCEYGVISSDLEGPDIGLSFLSITNLYALVKHVMVYDLWRMIRYWIGLTSIKTSSLDLSSVTGDVLEIIGYQLISDHFVKPLVNTKKIHSKTIALLRKHNVADTPITGTKEVLCRENKILIHRRENLMKANITYKCNTPEDYDKIYKLILLQKLFAGKIHRPNTIIKPVWKTKQ